MTQITQVGRLGVLAMVATLSMALPATAQTTVRRSAPSRSIEMGGYAMVGQFTFAATDSFDAILGTPSGTILGGGATAGLPWGGLFVDIGAWQFAAEGERVLILDGQVYPLGIPVNVSVVPLEISAGWKFRFRRLPKLIPYAAGGYTSMGYKETSSFSGAGEDVHERFGGYHLRGGAEFKITRWLGVAGEVAWTTIPDAIGEGGVSKAFGEDNLGGTSLRARITVGR
ncbi:MAG: hypothetical protein Q8T13_04690 [Acidobacteriota bacterium]|nr:hypothetical protein [Acidobacteriota bacterium]